MNTTTTTADERTAEGKIAAKIHSKVGKKLKHAARFGTEAYAHATPTALRRPISRVDWKHMSEADRLAHLRTRIEIEVRAAVLAAALGDPAPPLPRPPPRTHRPQPAPSVATWCLALPVAGHCSRRPPPRPPSSAVATPSGTPPPTPGPCRRSAPAADQYRGLAGSLPRRGRRASRGRRPVRREPGEEGREEAEAPGRDVLELVEVQRRSRVNAPRTGASSSSATATPPTGWGASPHPPFLLHRQGIAPPCPRESGGLLSYSRNLLRTLRARLPMCRVRALSSVFVV